MSENIALKNLKDKVDSESELTDLERSLLRNHKVYVDKMTSKESEVTFDGLFEIFFNDRKGHSTHCGSEVCSDLFPNFFISRCGQPIVSGPSKEQGG